MGFRESNAIVGKSLPQENFANLAVFEKNFYMEHPAVTARSDDEIAAYRSKFGIAVEGEGVPKPITSFQEAAFPDYVLSEVLKAGFTEPTPIQAQAREGEAVCMYTCTGTHTFHG